MFKKKGFNIKNMKPNPNSKHQEGYYALVNEYKYIGDVANVIYRSSYELTMWRQLDMDDDVIYWCAEPPQLKIKYFNPVKQRWSSYFPDAFCLKRINGKEVKCILEVKPKSKLKPPNKPKTNDLKKQESYQRRLGEHKVIDAKRKASIDFARQKGMEYVFITEDTVKK